MCCGNQEAELPLIVVSRTVPSLFGHRGIMSFNWTGAQSTYADTIAGVRLS